MMTHQMTIADQTTRPLSTDAVVLQSALRRHHLSLLRVARASGVRYLTAWRVAQGLPVRQADAARLRAGLARLTGYPLPTRGGDLASVEYTPMEEEKGWEQNAPER